MSGNNGAQVISGDIFDIKRFAIHDGPGIRTTVFMRGCPLRCWWCHNPEAVAGENGDEGCIEKTRKRFVSSDSMRSSGREIVPADLVAMIERDRVFFDQSSGGITFSGGEPLMQEDFLLYILGRCRERRLHTAVDTSGYAPWEMLEKVTGLADMILYDIKIVDDGLHRKYTGVSNRLILENMDRVLRSETTTWIRIPLIPGITDTPGNIDSIIDLLKGYDTIDRVSLLPYNRIGEDKFRRFGLEYLPGPMSVQADGVLASVRERFSQAGLNAVIGG